MTSQLSAQPPNAAATSAVAYLLVAVAAERVGIPMDRVHEVVPARPVTPLPGAPPSVHGLVNVRGRLVTLIDLGVALGAAPCVGTPDHRIVVVRRGGRLIGLAASDVLRAEPIPDDALRPGDGAAVGAVAERDGERIRLIDPDGLLAPLFG